MSGAAARSIKAIRTQTFPRASEGTRRNHTAVKGPRSRGPFASTREALERGFDESGQRLDLVAAFEPRSHPGRHCRAPLRQLAEAVLGHPHLGQGIVVMRVEARGDEHEF